MSQRFDRMRNAVQYVLPQRGLTQITYRLTRIRNRWFKNAFTAWFIRQFKVDMSEAAQPDYRAYEHFNAFFTRALRDDARPIADNAATLCCPVDGSVSQCGSVDDDQIYQAKGHHYSLTQLLGNDETSSALFKNGSFATLYLSPRDYHRIHMPYSGQLRKMTHIPGKLFSVSPLTTRMVPSLFARNERVVALFETNFGPMAVIMVGAINVASIETTWAGVITPPLGKTIRTWDYSGDNSIKFNKGDELGRFNMGSTVIVLLPSLAIEWKSTIAADQTIRMGQAMAKLTNTQ